MGNYISMVSRWGNLCAEKEGGCYCHFCGVKVKRAKIQGDIYNMTIDHMIPQSRGGETILDNLVLCCLGCNAEKSDTPYIEFWNKKADIRKRNRLIRLRDLVGRKSLIAP